MIDLTEEQEILDESIREIFVSLGEQMQRASGELFPKVRPGCHASSTWTSGFTRLTLFYPTLQTESLSSIPRHQVRSANVARVLLLIYSFVHDRQTDGQIDTTDVQQVFAEVLLRWASILLNRLSGKSSPSQLLCPSYEDYLKNFF